MAACFKQSDPYSEGAISLLFEILVYGINLDDMCCLKKASSCFKIHVPSSLKQVPAFFKQAAVCFKKAPACFQLGPHLFKVR